MPLASALLLLLGLSAHGGGGCLQCDLSVRKALGQLRLALIPKRFHPELLQARAQAVLVGMEGPFFRDYAVNAFAGKVGACSRGGVGFLALGGGGTWGVARGWGERRRFGDCVPKRGGWEHSWRKMGVSPGSLRDPLEFPPLLSPGIDHLEDVASFIKNQISHLMVNSLRGRS